MGESLAKILETPSLMEMMDGQTRERLEENDVISNVQQTKEWRQILAENYDKEVTVLRIDPFIDDAEMRNGMELVNGEKSPVFRQVHKIYLSNDGVCFLFEKIITSYFCAHYHDYEVEVTDTLSDFIHI
ncbi:hypothetical protein QAD02_011376 [Eretmocerus hayati]|uniref:Uncharacterized protein n=1 Tax=Eretmocerus hayati TaxID=131215 RepID=A0ACC2NWL3_9HYME|nr:hypothetical protein QAD02_011376 [Eretmocerus hayati]